MPVCHPNDNNTHLMASLSKIKAINHDVTQAFKGMYKEIANSQSCLIAWQRGQSGSPILNLNDNTQTNPGMTHIDCLIKDSNGEFMCGFNNNIGYSNIHHA